MTVRSAMAVLLALVLMISAIELSTWALGRVMSVIVPSASVSELETPVPHSSEVDTSPPTAAPALTW